MRRKKRPKQNAIFAGLAGGYVKPKRTKFNRRGQAAERRNMRNWKLALDVAVLVGALAWTWYVLTY